MSDIEEFKKHIGKHPDFPQKGIIFRDVFPLFQNPVVLGKLVKHMVSQIRNLGQSIDVIVGLDARGFLFGPLLSLELGASFVPVRKPGKLPGKTVTETYIKEYGEDSFQIQKDSIRQGHKVIIVDDLLATGGSLFAAGQLVKKCGATVIENLVVIELSELNGRSKLSSPVYSVLQY
eukprot:Sdes_comp18969_c0_seq1m9498